MAKEMAASNGRRCRNCGEVLHGAYCAVCGQPESDGHPPTIRHFLHDLSHEFLHLDGKIFRTLGILFFQPGRLTEEYWTGRVSSSIRPLRIFIFIAFLHVLISQGEGPLNHKVIVARPAAGGDLRANIVSGLIDSETTASYLPWYAEEEERTIGSEEELQRFSHEFSKAYSVIRYTSVLLFALAAWLLYRREQPYFIYHLVWGLHFYSFWYAIAALASLPSRTNPIWSTLSLLAFPYLFMALGRLFQERWFVRLGKAIALYLFVHVTELGLGYAAARWIER